MKKFMKLTLLSLVAVAVLLGTAGMAQALSFATEAEYHAYLKANPNDPQLSPAERAKARLLIQQDEAEKLYPGATRKDVPVQGKTSVDGQVRTGVVASISETFASFKGRFEVVIKNLEATHTRLSQLADRVEARLKKVSSSEEKDKIDVTAKMKFVTAARENLRAAKASIEAAKTSFKSESATVTTETTKTDDSKEIWGTEIYAKCKANSGVVKATTPARCTLDGTTYVNADRKTDDTKEIAKPVEFRGKLVKTLANIKAAKEHFIKAHRNLIQAISGVGVGATMEINKANVGAKASVPVNTSATVNPTN